MLRKVSIFFFFVFLFLQLGAKGIWNFPNTGFKQIPPASRQVIESKLLTNAAFQQKFLDDFGALGSDELLAMMELMAKNNGAAVDNWLLMLQNTIEEERKMVAYLESSTLTNSLIRYYGENSFKTILRSFDESKKQKFLRDFGDAGVDWFNDLKNKPEAINRWKALTDGGKKFAKDNPSKWLYVFDRLYLEFEYGQKLSNSVLLNLFGQRGVNLVNSVETHALVEYANALSNNARKRKVLSAGASCQVTNQISIKTNWTDEILNTVEANGKSFYQNYIDTMFPNLKKKVKDVIAFNRENYNAVQGYDVKRTGNFPGTHAEIQAIDELAKIRFDINNPPSDATFDNWLKNDVLAYNRNLMVPQSSDKVIMHTCADCFHILDLVTFINNF